jgi:glycine/D-amino acid oxidase-like deaminating enzyme
VLGQKIATPRAEVFYFGLPRGDSRFLASSIPCVSGEGFYAYPSIGRGLMMAPSAGGPQVDPDTQERVVSAHNAKRARDLVGLRYPGLRDEPIVDSRVCQLETTADRHFIIDLHPQFSNLWIAGGGSGHGFEHGPVIGQYVAGSVTGEPVDASDQRFFGLEKR